MGMKPIKHPYLPSMNKNKGQSYNTGVDKASIVFLLFILSMITIGDVLVIIDPSGISWNFILGISAVLSFIWLLIISIFMYYKFIEEPKERSRLSTKFLFEDDKWKQNGPDEISIRLKELEKIPNRPDEKDSNIDKSILNELRLKYTLSEEYMDNLIKTFPRASKEELEKVITQTLEALSFKKN